MWQVIGQPRAVVLLKQGLEAGNLAHAYLFVGPHHVGKMTLALSLAQALNCEAEDRPCGKCPSCQRIAAGKHADVQTIKLIKNRDSASDKLKTEIGINQIKEMQHTANLKPYEGKHRIFIIDGAELLTNEAANCLLKTLEEPPPNVLIILLAVSDSRLRSTVISRCQRVELRSVAILVVEEALVNQWRVPLQTAKTLAWLSRGCIGWAVSAVTDERLLPERSEKLTQLLNLADASVDERFTYAARLATQFSRNRDSVREVLDLWLWWWRDLLLVKSGCANLTTNIDKASILHHQALGYSLSQIKGFIESLLAALDQLEKNANPRLVFEVLMLNIPKKENGGKSDRVFATQSAS